MKRFLLVSLICLSSIAQAAELVSPEAIGFDGSSSSIGIRVDGKLVFEFKTGDDRNQKFIQGIVTALVVQAAQSGANLTIDFAQLSELGPRFSANNRTDVEDFMRAFQISNGNEKTIPHPENPSGILAHMRAVSVPNIAHTAIENGMVLEFPKTIPLPENRSGKLVRKAKAFDAWNERCVLSYLAEPNTKPEIPAKSRYKAQWNGDELNLIEVTTGKTAFSLECTATGSLTIHLSPKGMGTLTQVTLNKMFDARIVGDTVVATPVGAAISSQGGAKPDPASQGGDVIRRQAGAASAPR